MDYIDKYIATGLLMTAVLYFIGEVMEPNDNRPGWKYFVAGSVWPLFLLDFMFEALAEFWHGEE